MNCSWSTEIATTMHELESQKSTLRSDPDKLDVGTTASGIAADDAGTIYAADVAAHNLRKYVKVK